MPQPLLTAALYQQVRDAVEPGLSSTVLPDSVIGGLVYAGRAELDVLAVDPFAYTRTDPGQVSRLQAAAILLCASYLRLSWQPLRRETVGPYSYDRQRQDPMEAAQVLRQAAYAELAALLNMTGVVGVVNQRPVAAALAAGGRGDLTRTVDPADAVGPQETSFLGWPE